MQSDRQQASPRKAPTTDNESGGDDSLSVRRIRSSKDPLRKLNSIGRSIFRSLLLTTSSPTSAADSGKRAVSAERPPQQQLGERKSERETGKSRSQQILSAATSGDDDNQVRTDCCLPLSQLMVQQQHQVVAQARDKQLSKFARLIKNKHAAEPPSRASKQTLASGSTSGWPIGQRLQTEARRHPEEDHHKPHQEHQSPILQQPQSAQQKLSSEDLASSKVSPVSPAAPKWAATDKQQPVTSSLQRHSAKRVLSASSNNSGNRPSGGVGATSADRMGKLIALLDEQYVRRRAYNNLQQSSVMGSLNLISDFTCDPSSSARKASGASGQVSDNCDDDDDYVDDDDDEDEIFHLEESWRSFVKSPSLSSANQPMTTTQDAAYYYDEDTESPEVDSDERSQRRRANRKIQQDAIWELLTTEVFYIKRLKVIIDLFLATLIELQQHSLLLEIDPKQVFSNIMEIYEANCSFWANHLHPMLMEARTTRHSLDPTRMRNAFAQMKTIFNPYYRYCLDHRACLGYLKEQNRSNECFKVYLAWCESQKDCERLRLVDLLAKPMQRLTRYSLLLKAIAKKTDNQADLVVLEQMIAHMSRFVLTVDLELRRQEELELLAATARRIDSMDFGGGTDAYNNDEIDRIVKSHYCRFDLTAPLFNCPFKCHRQLLYDSQLQRQPLFSTSSSRVAGAVFAGLGAGGGGCGGSLQLGQLRFKDAQISGKLDVVLLIFTDNLFVCKQLSPASRWHHHRYSAGSGGGGSQAAAPSVGGSAGPTSANRSPQHSLLGAAGSGLLGGLLGAPGGVGSASQADGGGCKARPRAGSHQCGSAQASLRVSDHQNLRQQHESISSPRAQSLILAPDAAAAADTIAGTTEVTAPGQQQHKSTNALIPQARATSHICVALNDSSPNGSLYLQRPHANTACGAARQSQSRKSSAPPAAVHQRPPAFHASSASLVGNAAREFFRRSAESSRSGDNQAASVQHKFSAASGSGHNQQQQQPAPMQPARYQQQQRTPRHLAQLADSRLRVIRSPYPVERLVMHELKGGQGVFVCQLNDSLTIANSFVLYFSSSSSSQQQRPAPMTTTTATAASGQKRASGSDLSAKQQPAKGVQVVQKCPLASAERHARNSTRCSATIGRRPHLKLASRHSSNQDSSRSDSESQQLSSSRLETSDSLGATAADNVDPLPPPPPPPAGPARQLINLVKQAQARYRLAAKYHGLSVASFADPIDERGSSQQMEPPAARSRLSTWSSFKQSRRGAAATESSKRGSRPFDSQLLLGPTTSGAETTRWRKYRETKLERRSVSSENSAAPAAVNCSAAGGQQRPAAATPLAKALLEQYQSMLMSHGELLAGDISVPTAAEWQLPEATTSMDAGAKPIVCGKPAPASGDASPRAAGSQSSVFELLGTAAGAASCSQQHRPHPNSTLLQAPYVERKSFSSPASPSRRPPQASLRDPAVLLENQQLLSPNRYPGSPGSGGPRSPASGRRHFSRSPRLSASKQQQQASGELAASEVHQQHSPISANASSKSANSGTSLGAGDGSSDSELSSTRSLSPYVDTAWPTKYLAAESSSHPSSAHRNGSLLHSSTRSPMVRALQQQIGGSSELTDSVTSAGATASSGGSSQQRSPHTTRRNLSALRRQNVILSASSDQHHTLNQSGGQESLNINGRRPSDIVVQRERLQLAATNSWLSSSQSRDYDEPPYPDNMSSARSDGEPGGGGAMSGHLAPSSGRHRRQLLAHHHYQYLTSSSQATTVDQTNSAVFDSGDQVDPTLPVLYYNQQQLDATGNTNPGSASFELGHLGGLSMASSHNHHHYRNSSCYCTADTSARSASMETRSPISVTLTLPNNEASLPDQLEGGQQQVSSRASTSPVYLSIPLPGEPAQSSPRRSLLSPIDSVPASSPIADEHDLWHLELASSAGEPDAGSDTWIYDASGDERARPPELNIISEAADGQQQVSAASAERQLGCTGRRRRSSEIELQRMEPADWPRAISRRRSSSMDEFQRLSSEIRHMQAKQHATGSANFLLRFLPQRLKRRYGSPRRCDKWLQSSKPSGAAIHKQELPARAGESGAPSRLSSETSASDDDTAAASASNWIMAAVSSGSAGNLVGALDTSTILGANNSGGSQQSGYLGFHEKLRLHDNRLREAAAAAADEDKKRTTTRLLTGVRQFGAANKWPSGGHQTTTTTNSNRERSRHIADLAWHSASSTANIGPSESRSFRALNLTRSVTGELFDSILKATSLRSMTGSSVGGF